MIALTIFSYADVQKEVRFSK